MQVVLQIVGLNYLFLNFFRCVVSGSGKIALHVTEKLLAYGALPITVSGKFSNAYMNYS
ncbi:hypothetical protein CK203_003099 [Vitis vinifera]|uniref:Uncharacterized protein n=1 Tax=Vitis vinifera TaxID=29760 RepID=A0A438K7E1_VITVI|nr:hypothetical protein CK203_003099 [Vitis vinifera]